mgnify:CR=1 FL=1
MQCGGVSFLQTGYRHTYVLLSHLSHSANIQEKARGVPMGKT